MQGAQTNPSARFQKLFQLEANTHCLNCGRPSKQWAQLSHAIFLCLDCAAAFRDFTWVTRIKSVHLDQWTSQQLDRLERGGNQSFGKFLRVYGLELADVRTKVSCKASSYYRALLDGQQQGQQPGVEEGRLISKQNIPLADMSPEEIFESAKQKALWFGGKTKELGKKGISKVQEKWQSGEIKEGAKNVATSVSTKAKWLWGKVKSKVGELTSSDKNNQN